MGTQLRSWWPHFRLALQHWQQNEEHSKKRSKRTWHRYDSGYQSGSDVISETDSDLGAMGKSNKFDYSNRTNSGVKLGEIIGKAVSKEASKLAKTERKLDRKKSTDSSGQSNIEIKDHPIDLKAPGKELGDDGVFALAEGLEAALSHEDGGAPLQLEELNLADNQLTTASLARLASAIKLAWYDVKSIDLSSNNIIVVDDKQAAEWETFLLSFASCCRLRRLDLSNNTKLGARAFEILARVHSREPPIDALPPGGHASVISLIEEEMPDDLIKKKVTIAANNELFRTREGKGLDFTVGKGRPTPLRHGLRSLPFITVNNVNLTDSGALWLSFVLENHSYPIQLIDEQNATLANSSIAAYQQDADTKGLSWDGNDSSLGRDGSYLLMRTEAVRRNKLIDDSASIASSHASVIFGSSESDKSSFMLERKLSMFVTANGYAKTTRLLILHSGRRDPRVSPGNRRASAPSTLSTEAGDQEACELNSARKKIQRHIIRIEGASTVELWRAGLQVVACSRLLLLLAPHERSVFTGETMWKPKRTSLAPAVQGSPAPTLNYVKPAKADEAQPGDGRSYAATLTPTASGTVGEPETAIVDITNMPIMPKSIIHSRRKGAFSEGTDTPALIERFNKLRANDDLPGRFLEYQQQRVRETQNPSGTAGENSDHALPSSNPYRDVSMACHLPHNVVMRIMSLVMGEREVALLSDKQQREAVRWGQARATLMQGHEWVKKDESSQVWMLLDAVKCLEYESLD